MKKLTFILLLSSTTLSAQGVGINTGNPDGAPDAGTALHVGPTGTVKADNIPLVTSAQYVLVTDADGIFRKVLLSSLISQQPSQACPTFLRSESSGYYLKFSSTSSIQNPNNTLTIGGKTFVSAGTFIQNNTYYFTYSNTTGTPLNINNTFVVNFGTQQCTY